MNVQSTVTMCTQAHGLINTTAPLVRGETPKVRKSKIIINYFSVTRKKRELSLDHNKSTVHKS